MGCGERRLLRLGGKYSFRRVFRGWQTIEEYNEGAQMLTTSYIHGNYIDEVLSLRKADGSGNVREYFVHQDDLFRVMTS